MPEKLKRNAGAAREELLREGRTLIDAGMACGTVDGWMTLSGSGSEWHTAHRVSYVNEVDEKWVLIDGLLCPSHCSAESVTAEVINDSLKMAKAELNIDPEAKMHYTTDDGADVVAAVKMSGQERSYCMDHCTNLVVKKAMQAQLTKLDLFGDMGGQIVDKVAESVNIILSSKSKFVRTLKQQLKRGPINRSGQRIFRSSLPMLKAAKVHFKKVRLQFQKITLLA